MPRLLGGFVSPSLRWWSPWWWPLVHLRSFRCRLLDGSHYTRLANVRQIETTQTPLKPLQTLAFIGVSQPHDGDTKTADATATATARHGHTQGRHGHITTATPRDVTTSRARRARCSHVTTWPRSHKRNVPARYHTTRQNTIVQTFQRCAMQQTPPWGSVPPAQKARPLAL